MVLVSSMLFWYKICMIEMSGSTYVMRPRRSSIRECLQAYMIATMSYLH